MEVSARVVSRQGAHEVEVRADARRRALNRAHVRSPEPAAAIEALLRHTDSVAEIQNTVRAGLAVELVQIDVPATSGAAG